MKKSFLVAFASLFLLCSSSTADAKLVEIWGSGLVGGGWGRGDTDKDFYKFVSGGAAGFEVGAKILFIGAFVDYLRWFGGSAGANLITFNIGGDWTFDLSDSVSFVVRGAGGYYYGTLPDDVQIVQDGIPITEVNTRGVGARAGVGLRYNFLKVFSVGVTPEVGYHYFFGGAHTDVTDNNSSGVDITVLAYLRAGLGF